MKPDFSVAGVQVRVSLNTCSAGFHCIVVTLPINLTPPLSQNRTGILPKKSSEPVDSQK